MHDPRMFPRMYVTEEWTVELRRFMFLATLVHSRGRCTFPESTSMLSRSTGSKVQALHQGWFSSWNWNSLSYSQVWRLYCTVPASGKPCNWCLNHPLHKDTSKLSVSFEKSVSSNLCSRNVRRIGDRCEWERADQKTSKGRIESKKSYIQSVINAVRLQVREIRSSLK